jgi:hypothetical protein
MSLTYTAPPTLSRFMKSNAFGRMAAGPVGSGKTTACIVEVLRRAMAQGKAADGYRYTRFAIVRQTLKQLRDTILKDCQIWLQGLGEWKVSENTFYLDFGEIKSELVFIPLEDATDQARLLSMQLTGAWLSEAIEMNFDILAPVSSRIGRYPSGQRGSPSWYGIIADTNMPRLMSDWHRFMTEPPADFQVFIQPSGMSPQAENLNHLLQTEETSKLPINHPDRLAQGRKYYERFLELYGSDHPWVRRYVYAEYADDPSGEAVFKATWRTSFHTAPETLVIPGYPLIVGIDFGRNPWALICQVDHTGRLLVHEEVPAINIGLEKQVEERLRPRLYSNKFMGAKVVLVGDPAGAAKGTIAEETSFDALKRMGLSAFPAPTNDIDARLRAVETLLARNVAGKAALVINSTGCPFLVRAMAGGYRFKKNREGGLRAIPEKFDAEGWSHVVDALQYVCLTVNAGSLFQEFVRRAGRKPGQQQRYRPAVTAAGWT